MSRILLTSDIPPCTTTSGGLFLEQTARMLPPHVLGCVSFIHPLVVQKPTPSTLPEFQEQSLRIQDPHPFRVALATKLPALSDPLCDAMETWMRRVQLPKALSGAEAFGRSFKPDLIWALLQSPTSIRVAARLSARLGVPMLVQVMDPPDTWPLAFGYSARSMADISQEFSLALSQSIACIATSWAMAREYQEQFGIPTTVLIPWLAGDQALPAGKARQNDHVVIGIAGQLYADQEWQTLVSTLQQKSWSLLGRRVRIRLIGDRVQLQRVPDGNMELEFLGWRGQEEALRLLAECDVLYCPYRFAAKYANEARLCFPSKLTTYLATGRPVLFHGPDFSSPGQLLLAENAAACCFSADGDSLYAELERLVGDQDRYETLAANGLALFQKQLAREPQQVRFEKFLQSVWPLCL